MVNIAGNIRRSACEPRHRQSRRARVVRVAYPEVRGCPLTFISPSSANVCSFLYIDYWWFAKEYLTWCLISYGAIFQGADEDRRDQRELRV